MTMYNAFDVISDIIDELEWSDSLDVYLINDSSKMLELKMDLKSFLFHKYGLEKSVPSGFSIVADQNKFYSFAFKFLLKHGPDYSDDAKDLNEQQFAWAFHRCVSGDDNYFKID